MQKTNKPEEELKTRSLKEYLASTKESIEVFRWLYREMTTTESKRHMRNLFICLVASVVVQSFQPGSVSYVFDGLRLKNHSFIIGGLTAFLLSLIAQKIVQRFHDQAREWILGIHMGQIDERLSTYFFGKSLAQHAQESHILSPSTIDKGKWKALDVQRILLFDGTATILQLGISICCLFFLHWTAGTIMALVNGIASGGEISFSKKLTGSYSALYISWLSWIFIAITNLIISFALGEVQYPVTLGVFWLYQVLYATAGVLGFWAVMEGFKYVEASIGGLLGLLEIVFSIVLGMIIFNQEPSLKVVFGGLLIIIAAALPHISGLMEKREEKGLSV